MDHNTLSVKYHCNYLILCYTFVEIFVSQENVEPNKDNTQSEVYMLHT